MTLNQHQIDALRLLCKCGDWTRLGDVTGIRRGCFTVNYMTGRALSRKGLVEKRDAQVRINATGRAVLEVSQL